MRIMILRRLLLLLVTVALSGCQSHFVTNEFYVSNEEPTKNDRCVSAKVQPILLSKHIRTNSIFWLPIIPAPWNDKKSVENINVQVSYQPAAEQCSVSDVVLISNGVEYAPEQASLSAPQDPLVRCHYRFSISAATLVDTKNAFRVIKNDACNQGSVPLFYIKTTDYENHFTPW